MSRVLTVISPGIENENPKLARDDDIFTSLSFLT